MVGRAPYQVLVLPFRRNTLGLEVAVFERADYRVWQFVSGGGEQGEAPDSAARRELQEEAGVGGELIALDATTTIPACWFRAWSSWPQDVLVIPEHAFAVDVGVQAIALSAEHLQFEWLATETAMARLRFDSNKNALWELHERLFPGPRTKRPAYR